MGEQRAVGMQGVDAVSTNSRMGTNGAGMEPCVEKLQRLCVCGLVSEELCLFLCGQAVRACGQDEATRLPTSRRQPSLCFASHSAASPAGSDSLPCTAGWS